MGIEFISLSSLFVALSNFFFRKNIDNGGTSRAFLAIQLSVICLIAVLLNPVRVGEYFWTTKMGIFGLIGGIVLAGMMTCLGKALETGPAGLTISILNSSCVFPVLFMVLTCGSAFGYTYEMWHGIGSLLVVAGIFWGGRGKLETDNKFKWAFFALMTFALHVLFLLFMEWRGLYLSNPDAVGLFLSFSVDDMKSQWFMPMVFLSASLIQLFLFSKNEKRFPNNNEWKMGVIGGVMNGLGTFFLITGVERAAAGERAMLFPLWSVGIIFMFNILGKSFFKEKINWIATSLCMIGIFIGTVNWPALLAS